MIKITKELERNDGGTISPNSIVTYTPRLILSEMIISYDLKLYFNESALESGKDCITDALNFKLRLSKQCTKEEWLAFNSSDDSESLMQDWLKELLDSEIGEGFIGTV